MTEKKVNTEYYCNKCNRMHKNGKIFDLHKEFAIRSGKGTRIEKTLNEICKFIPEDVMVPENSLEICDLERVSVIKKIDNLLQVVYDQLNEEKNPKQEVPLRRKENIVYNEKGNLFLGKQTRTIELGDKYSELVKILRVAEIVKELLTKDIHATKREVFYTDVNLFKEQKYSDRTIEDLSALLGTYRKNLNIVGAPRGYCAGRLTIKDRDEIIDFKKFGTGGWTVSPMLDKIEIVESDAEFILVVEKDAAMMRLSEARFYDKLPCILLTSHGYPIYSVREFLKKLVNELKIPAFGLADSDPHGLSILMTHAYGSIQSAHETSRLAVNNFYWLGVTCSDLHNYNISDKVKLKMTMTDIKRTHEMLNDDFIQTHPRIKRELELMLKKKEKAEIQAFSSHGFGFLMEYITSKIESGDLIKF